MKWTDGRKNAISSSFYCLDSQSVKKNSTKIERITLSDLKSGGSLRHRKKQNPKFHGMCRVDREPAVTDKLQVRQ